MKYFYKADAANQRELAPGVKLKTMWGDKIMMSLVELDPGSEVPLHSHPNEQAGMVLEGEFEFTIGTEFKKVKEGEYYIIPGGIEHRLWQGPNLHGPWIFSVPLVRTTSHSHNPGCLFKQAPWNFEQNYLCAEPNVSIGVAIVDSFCGPKNLSNSIYCINQFLR